jgi:hypothetical protein
LVSTIIFGVGGGTACERVLVKVDDGQMDGDRQLSWADGSARPRADQSRGQHREGALMEDRFEVMASAGTMMSGSRAAICFPHRWTRAS